MLNFDEHILMLRLFNIPSLNLYWKNQGLQMEQILDIVGNSPTFHRILIE